MRALWALLAGLMLASVALPATDAGAQDTDELSITFAAVRQGDGAVYQGPCGEVAVIDTPAFRETDMLAVLDRYGSRQVDWMLATHYHADHVGGLPGVAGAPGASVDTVYDRGGGADAYDSQTYRSYHAWATGESVSRQPVRIGDTLSLCSGEQEVSFEVLSVGVDGTARGGTPVTNEDDHSICVRMVYRQFTHATCGDLSGTDAGDRTDMESVVAPAMGSVDVAQINHHGSADSSNATWVDTLDPAVAVVSTGANPHGHPDPGVLDRWRAGGADVYQTQDGDNAPVHGDVTVTTTGDGGFTVTTSTGESRDYAGGGPGQPPGDSPIAEACPPERVPPGGFTDTAGNTHAEAIDCIVWYGITHGAGADRYNPAGRVTRDQMASFIARAVEAAGMDLPPPQRQGFTDILGNAHEARILQLAQTGLTQGTSPTTYSPRLRVQRAQMATFLVRVFERVSGTPLAASRDYFADDNGNAHEDNINKAAEAGFTTGTSATAFSPSDAVRRDQMASFIARMLNRLVVDGHMTAEPSPRPDPPPPPPPDEPDPEPASCVDINSENNLEELQRIIHIGPDRAQQILELRPFSSVDDMQRISGIGPARLQDIKNQGLASISC